MGRAPCQQGTAASESQSEFRATRSSKSILQIPRSRSAWLDFGEPAVAWRKRDLRAVLETLNLPGSGTAGRASASAQPSRTNAGRWTLESSLSLNLSVRRGTVASQEIHLNSQRKQLASAAFAWQGCRLMCMDSGALVRQSSSAALEEPSTDYTILSPELPNCMPGTQSPSCSDVSRLILECCDISIS